ncbi:MAG: DUF3228 family protein [Lentisphaeraceae bacterium]|nr:DUF3228 family protein [Lentisphaeraceae bacterium]
MTIQMCEFAERQYDQNFHGTKVTPEIVEELISLADNPVQEFPGYADFCKILAISNKNEDGSYKFPSLKCLTVDKKWALENGATLHTDYEARNDNEVAVLVEWITGIETPVADFVHLILYSREQMEKEGDVVEADWAIVSIGGAATVEVEPMRPITAMRNALGVEEGGSGVVIDRKAYKESVEFWSKYSMIRE